jgi:Smg protein
VKEDMLDVLMYLFENLDDDILLDEDQESLKAELIKEGFSETEINKAFLWLEDLAENSNLINSNHQGLASIRIYTLEECEKLDVECRGFLLFLEQVGVLNPTSREFIIDRVMALDTDDFDLEQLKWVILMVLFNQPGQEEDFSWIEDMVYDKMTGHLH